MLAIAICVPRQARGQEVVTYLGMCDASAAVAIGRDHFVVADDERNTLLIYKQGQPRSVGSLQLSTFLGTKNDKESDLEGAATIGRHVYWISSHGRNSAGEVQKRRYRFFATEIQLGQTPALAPVPKPYTNLLGDLATADKLKAYNLADAATRPPEAPDGLNIEGLAATPNGKLLVGFRNPIPGGLALVVPIENPKRLVKGKKAKFGSPIELDLGGRGIRSIELVGSSYLMVAGPPADSGSFALYRWSGRFGDAATVVQGIDFKSLHPEALFALPGTDTVQVLSDDGGVETDGVACKDRDKSKQSFRSTIIRP